MVSIFNKHNKIKLLECWNLKHCLYSLGCLFLLVINHPSNDHEVFIIGNVSYKIFNFSEQWSEYETFFNEDLSFRKEVKEAIRHHFKAKKNSDFEIYDYLIRIIKARISISGILKSRIDKKRTDLLETIHKPQMLLPDMRHFNFVSFFSYMLLNSDLFIETKHKSCVIKLELLMKISGYIMVFS